MKELVGPRVDFSEVKELQVANGSGLQVRPKSGGPQGCDGSKIVQPNGLTFGSLLKDSVGIGSKEWACCEF